MTEDIEFLRSMAAACRKEARAERRRRPREELMLFAERMDSIATRCAHLVAIGKKHAPMEATLYLSSAQRVPGEG